MEGGGEEEEGLDQVHASIGVSVLLCTNHKNGKKCMWCNHVAKWFFLFVCQPRGTFLRLQSAFMR
jgi:hypothetical protein